MVCKRWREVVETSKILFPKLCIEKHALVYDDGDEEVQEKCHTSEAVI